MRRTRKIAPLPGSLRARLSAASDWLRNLVDHDPHGELSRAQRIAARNMHVFLLMFRWEVYTKIKLHAQALTYVSLLSLVPLIAVVFAIFRGFGATDSIVQRVKTFLLSNVSGSPEQHATLSEYVDTFVGNVNAGGLGWISLLILVISVLMLLGHIESSLNAIFGVTVQRPLVSRMVTYWSVLTFGPLLLAASFALTAGLQSATFESYLEGLGGLWAAAVAIAPLVATWTAFTVMYMVVPSTRVRFSAAALAAVITGTAWHGSKALYSWYAKAAVAQEVIYGSLSAIPIFVLWLYITWLLVLFGAQLTFAFQNAETYRREDERLVTSQLFVERATCRLYLEVARAFHLGKTPPTPEELTAKLRIPRRLLMRLVDRLKDGALLRATEPDGGLLPGRDLAEVTVSSLLEELRAGEGPDPSLVTDPARGFFDKLLAEVADNRAELTGRVTFKDLAEQFSRPAPEPLPTEQSASDVH